MVQKLTRATVEGGMSKEQADFKHSQESGFSLTIKDESLLEEK